MRIVRIWLELMLRFFGISLAGGILGCAVPSPDSQMGNLASPSSWAASREAKAGIDRNWVASFGGAGLKNAVQEALSSNQDMRAAAARVDQAAAEARIAGAGRLPSLSAGASGQRSKQNFIGFPSGGGGEGLSSLFDQFGVSLSAAWELDVWGKMRANQQAAIADAEASDRDFQAARVSLAAQVTKAWLALAEANEQVKLAEEGLVARRTLASAVRERFDRAIDTDGGSAAQVRLTAAEVSNGEGQLAQRKQERERVIRQMEILLGRYPSGSWIGAAVMPNFPRQTPAGLPSELLLRRPDILAAERRLAAATSKRREARLARFPSIRLTASSGTNSDALGRVLRSDLGIWSLAGSVTQPIFEGGKLLASEQRASAKEREEMAILQKTVLAAFGEVEQSLAAESFLAERERAAKQTKAMASEAAQRADEEFSAGTGDVLTLIDAKKLEIDSASQYVAIRRLRLENRVDLHLALGGDFSVSPK